MNAPRRRLLALPLLALLLALASCGDATGPERLTGTYVLASVNGAPLPVRWSETAESTFDVAYSRLAFSESDPDWYGLQFHLSETDKETGRTSRLPTYDLSAGTYARQGSRITFTPDYGRPPFSGTIRGAQITVETKAENGSTLELVYEEKPAA